MIYLRPMRLVLKIGKVGAGQKGDEKGSGKVWGKLGNYLRQSINAQRGIGGCGNKFGEVAGIEVGFHS